MTETIFANISIVLGVAILLSLAVQLLRQPMIISYIATGILAGPFFLNLIGNNKEYFEIFAEFGVIFLLFLVGLSLNFHFLKKIGKIAAFTGIGQVIFTSLVGFAILLWLGFDKEFSIYLALAITFSSTIIIMKLLAEKKETETVYGRYTIGLMLIQDIIAILLLILLPALKDGDSIFFSIFVIFIKSALFLAFVYGLSRVVIFLINKFADSGEFLFIFTVAWCFAIAGLSNIIGLSLEVGAIIAGVALGSSAYQAEISSRLKPLRDFFIVIFFIILGSEMNIGNIDRVLIPGIIVSLFVLIGNPLILYLLYRLMKFTRRVSFKAGLTAAQVSEFGFVFLFVVEKEGYYNSDLLPIFTFIALTTIFLSSYLITYNSQIFRKIEPLFRIFGKDKYVSPEKKKESFAVLVFGYHRLGWKVCDTLKGLGIPFAVVDFDPIAIERMKERKIPHYFGDATDIELLEDLPLSKTKMIISTMPSTTSQITMIKYMRKKLRDAVIIANLSYSRFLDEMYEAGADYVLVPHLVSGEWLANILKKGAWQRNSLKKLVQAQKESIKLKNTPGCQRRKNSKSSGYSRDKVKML